MNLEGRFQTGLNRVKPAAFPRPMALAALAAGASAWPACGAPAPTAVDQADSINRRRAAETLGREAGAGTELAPELFIGEVRDVGPQHILRTRPARRYFAAALDSEYLYTSNVFLEDGGDPTATTILSSYATVMVAPTPGYQVGRGKLSPRCGYTHQWYVYSLGDPDHDFSDFNFDSQMAFADARYAFGNQWTVEAGFYWRRLVNHVPDYFDYNEFYSEHVPQWGVQKTFQLSPKHVVTLAYQGNYRFTDSLASVPSDANDRSDQALTTVYTLALTARLIAQPYYRFQYSFYPDAEPGGRNDYTHTLGGTLTWFFTEQFAVRAAASWEARQSDATLSGDFTKFDGGVGINFFLTF